MSKFSKNKFIIIPLALLAVLCIYLAISHNKLVAKEEKMINTWNDLQARYQRRMDLIPELAKVVKASSDYEKNLLIKLTEIRAQSGTIKTSGDPESNAYNDLQNVQEDFANTFNKVLAVVEKYPELKSQENYAAFQEQIKGTENRIKFARKDFNESIADYNQYVRSFPSNISAKIFGYKVKEGFTSEVGASKATEIKF